ncbi:hypothetical protein [Bacillus pseudomycoides]|uniref:hypothetical protein n=1 Tax=Bacillus pseudomycoides TaxID=64104 RepID=UPI000BFCED46|nr:hypothetical protein [Bacillus pseudomycoides]MED1535440.1 hypothetical protein [Bacillus pseudomycoides]PHG24663.1 hypothetical protein COI47_07690 [Bacillus pseudomycoides]
MFTAHTWRYGRKYEEEFDTYKEAQDFATSDTGKFFVEKITDEDGNEVVDYKENVFGYRE